MSLKLRKFFKSEAIFLIISVMIGLTLSLFALSNNYFIWTDGCVYAIAGKNLIEGKGYTFSGKPQLFYPPLYPIAIGLLYKVIGNLELAGHLVSVISWIGTIVIFFFLVKEFYRTSRVAILATFLLASNGFLVIASSRVMSESLFIFLILSSLYLTIKILGSSMSLTLFALNGFVLGLSYLTRPEGFFFFVVTLFSLFFLGPANKRQKSIGLLAVLTCFSFLAFPYVIFLHSNTGKWQLSGKTGHNLILGEKITSDVPISIERFLLKLSGDKRFVDPMYVQKDLGFFQYLKEHPKAMAIRYIENLKIMQRTVVHLISLLGLLLISASFFATDWDSIRKRKEGFLLLVIPISLVYPFFLVLERFLFPFLVIFIIWESRGLLAVRDWLRYLLGLDKLITGLVLTFGLIIVSYSLRPVIDVYKQELPYEYKEMGIWMKEHIKGIEKEYVVSRTPWVSFYAGAKHLTFPYVDSCLLYTSPSPRD